MLVIQTCGTVCQMTKEDILPPLQTVTNDICIEGPSTNEAWKFLLVGCLMFDLGCGSSNMSWNEQKMIMFHTKCQQQVLKMYVFFWKWAESCELEEGTSLLWSGVITLWRCFNSPTLRHRCSHTLRMVRHGRAGTWHQCQGGSVKIPSWRS